MVPSKISRTFEVPTTFATESPAVPDNPDPRVPMHTTEVWANQLLVELSATEITPVTVALVEAKFMPINVTLVVTAATLYGDNEEIVGAVQKKSIHT